MSDGSAIDTLCAEIDERQVRTYKIVRGASIADSHAQTIADLYGIDFEKLISNRK